MYEYFIILKKVKVYITKIRYSWNGYIFQAISDSNRSIVIQFGINQLPKIIIIILYGLLYVMHALLNYGTCFVMS